MTDTLVNRGLRPGLLDRPAPKKLEQADMLAGDAVLARLAGAREPEGLEAGLQAQDFADLLSFLTGEKLR